ncbi:hypothetical protein FACS1894182_00740 [Bacteroidia bacterium]|nr:hypothetical protein FACS1894182_00740 [Bacteroidia bacterium]
MPMNIKPKEATAIIHSLISGVVPKTGVQHITVGRSKEIAMLLATLEEVKNGQSLMKFWIGDFGSGKSFMLYLLNTVALKQRFVVTQADFTPHIRLYSNDGKGQALYTALMDNLAIQTKPEGGALPVLLEKWIEQVIFNTAAAQQIALTEIRQPEYFPLIQNEIMQTLNAITETGAFDFGLAVIRYYEGFIRNDDDLRKNALRWMKGEYATKTEARNDLGVSDIVNDRNYYDMLKNFCRLFVSIGYNGLTVNLDEAVNLYNIVNPGMRQRNYEKLLNIYNDCFQGKTANLFVNVAGTIDVLEDPLKGFYSYDALKTRLKVNPFETAGMRDYAQPVLRLMPLNHNEIFVLLQNLKEIFDFNYQVEIDFPEKDIRTFMEEIFNKPGADEFLTPREVIRDFLNILNILRQNPEVEKNKLFREISITDERNTIALESEEDLKPAKTAIKPLPAETPERKTLTAELKYWERKIADRALKNRLNRMSRIAAIIQEKDPSAGELFFLRHADTLTKLLKQFHALESSGVDSPEINASKERIAGTIDATQKAFEQELKNRFQMDMLDIDAESEAYLQGLKNKGLIDP